MITPNDHISLQRLGAIQKIGFNRPDRKNAITAQMYQVIADALNAAADDAEVRVVLLHGSLTCFSAGNDIEDFLKHPPQNESSAVLQFLHAISTFPKPLVASVAGVAVGVGMTMLLHCDLVYAADNAKISAPFAQLGLCPEAASSLLFPMLAGYQKAAEKLLLGEAMSAQEASEMGLVNRVLPVGELEAVCLAQAEKLAALPASSLRVTKQLMKSGMSAAIAQRMKDENKHFLAMLSSPEAREAFGAFMQKRKPDFTQFS
jgi:enoyl-CoA hydratase/carnithine racemase